MPAVDSMFRTISCDAEGCDKLVTIQVFQGGYQKTDVDANPWLKTSRATQTFDGRIITHCSDECMVKSCSTGVLNAPEPKQVIDPGANTAAIAQAAAQAARAQRATEALKKGAGVSIA